MDRMMTALLYLGQLSREAEIRSQVRHATLFAVTLIASVATYLHHATDTLKLSF